MRAAALATGLALAGCKAERLGVRIPPTGIEAVNLEDLQRDTFGVAGPQVGSRGPGEPGAAIAAGWAAERFGQMELLPAFGGDWALPLGDGRALVCGQRDGETEDAIVIVALDPGEGAAHGAVPTAAVIALAKSFTGREGPEHTQVFCYAPTPGGLERYAATPPIPLDQTVGIYTLGPLSGGQLRAVEAEPAIGAVPTLHLSTARPPEPGPADRAEAVDFRRVLDRVRQARAWVDRVPTPGMAPSGPQAPQGAPPGGPPPGGPPPGGPPPPRP